MTDKTAKQFPIPKAIHPQWDIYWKARREMEALLDQAARATSRMQVAQAELERAGEIPYDRR
jgi:hypothetical protein